MFLTRKLEIRNIWRKEHQQRNQLHPPNLFSNIQLNSIRRGLVQQNSTMLQYKDTLYKLWNMRWSGHKKSTHFSLFLDSVLPTSNEAWSNSSIIWILYVIHLMDDKYILRIYWKAECEEEKDVKRNLCKHLLYEHSSAVLIRFDTNTFYAFSVENKSFAQQLRSFQWSGRVRGDSTTLPAYLVSCFNKRRWNF